MDIAYLFKNLISTITGKVNEAKDYTDTEIQKLATYTTETGQIKTKAWNSSQGGPTWSAPKAGVYLLFAGFQQTSDAGAWARAYKQWRIEGSGVTFLNQPNGFYQSAGGSSGMGILSISVCYPILCTTGAQVHAFIWTDTVDMTYNVTLTGIYIGQG